MNGHDVQDKYSRWKSAMGKVIEWRREQGTVSEKKEHQAADDRTLNLVASWVGQVVSAGCLLDVGCGPGYIRLARSFPKQVRYVGTDPLRIEGHRYGFPFVVAMAEWLPFLDSKCEAVLIKDSIDCFMDARLALSEIRRVLRPGGILLVSEAGHYDWGAWTSLKSLLALVKHQSVVSIFGLLVAYARRFCIGYPVPINSPRCITVEETYPGGDLSCEQIKVNC